MRVISSGGQKFNAMMPKAKNQSCKFSFINNERALQDGGTLSYFIRDVYVFFASFFLRKKRGTLLFSVFDFEENYYRRNHQ